VWDDSSILANINEEFVALSRIPVFSVGCTRPPDKHCVVEAVAHMMFGVIDSVAT